MNKDYASKLLRSEESILHVRARNAIGKQNYMKVSPEELFALTTELNKERIKNAELEAEVEKLQPKKKSVWTTTPDSTTTYVGNINDIDVRIK